MIQPHSTHAVGFEAATNDEAANDGVQNYVSLLLYTCVVDLIRVNKQQINCYWVDLYT